jgi:hypothetical protein
MSIPFRATWLGKRPCPNSGTWEVFATGLPGWPSVLSCCAGPASNLPGALWGLRLWHGGGGLWPRAERKLAHRESGNGGNASSQTLSVFCFLGEVRGDPLLLLPGLPLRVLAGSVAAVGSRTPRSWAAPRQGTGTVLAERRPAQLPFWTQAGRTTERSGVVLALETKFLRFETRQEQDSVLSRSPAFACNVCPRRPAIRAAGTTRFRPVPLRGCGARSR